MLISRIEGLKYPDEAVVRFFFKEGLAERQAAVTELGCSNGNNLMLFYQYGWDVAGVDLDAVSLERANRTFGSIGREYALSNSYRFLQHEMVAFAAGYRDKPADVLLLPNSIEYLQPEDIATLFRSIRVNGLINPQGRLFVRTRTPQDYRFGRGERLGPKTFRLRTPETGEEGCLQTFLLESELMEMLEAEFRFEYKRIFHYRFDNYQQDRLIPNNSDVIFWGQLKGFRE